MRVAWHPLGGPQLGEGAAALDRRHEIWYNVLMTDDLPSRALDVQLDLLRYYTRDEMGQRYADAVVSATLANEETGEDALISGIGIMLHERILIGETYAVRDEIVDTLEYGAETIPDFTIEAHDLPSPSGFVWLERPVVFLDRRGRNLVIRAFGWHVTDMTHAASDEAEAVREIAKFSPSLAGKATAALGNQREAMCVVGWTDPRDPRDHMHEEYVNIDRRLKAPQGLSSLVMGIWEIGVDPIWADKSSARFGAFVATFLRFINEPWVDYRQMLPSRHARKRCVRTKHAEPSIHVVQLRRALSRAHHAPPGDGPGQEWTHRWLVRGHWRNQWYPSTQTHRPKFIPSYVKGPEDKPLVVHDKIFSVER